VQILRLQALAYASLHKFPDAALRLEQADRICAASDYVSCGDVLRAHGRLEMERGNFVQGQIFYEKALNAARARDSRFQEATALLNLSWSADEQTHFDQALDWASESLRISIQSNFADIAQNAAGNMAWAYYKLGDPEKAERQLREAEAQAEKLDDVSDQVKWLTAAAYIDMDASDFKTAEQSFERSLKLSQQINSREDIINSLIALAFVYEQTGKFDDARRNADEALSMARADGNGRDIVYPLLVNGRIAAQQHDTTAAEKAFHEVAASKDSPVFLKWDAERSLARLYEDENQPALADKQYRIALTTFETARSELQHEDSRLPFLTNASRIYDDYLHFLVAQGKTAYALQVADFSRARTLAEGLGLLKKGTSFNPEALPAPQIARRAGGPVLFYRLGEKESYLWAIGPHSTKLFPLPAASEIDAVVQRYRKALVGPLDVLDTANSDGSALYHMLIEPAKDMLAANSRVFIIPDGSLNGLNFDTLLVPAPKLHYWIEDATIASANSLRLLAASHGGGSTKSPKLLLFGDAVAPNHDYPPLQNAAAEIETIGRHFAQVQEKAFTGSQATPPAYLASHPEQFSFIHFVAHGTASRLSPLDSAIVLSKATAQDDSFKLYARDIIRQPLKADLVTISTCYGAAGRAYSGEGLVGLSWAFLRAGAHNVIGALWEASDASTPLLMDQLYSQLQKGDRPETALRAAKLSLLHSGSAFRKPFYWAPFQLYTGS